MTKVCSGGTCSLTGLFAFPVTVPHRGIIPAGQLCTTYMWLLRGIKDIKSDINMSGKWSCKEKDTLEAVYSSIETTWNSQEVAQAGHHADTHLSLSGGSFICFSLKANNREYY